MFFKGGKSLEFLERIQKMVWGIPTMALILGMGLYLSWKTNWVQLRLFPKAVRLFLSGRSRQSGDGVSPFQALCTALAATVGTGNIAGVAGAIALGGPGAVFWMWICGLTGMVIKYAEAVLAQRYRVRNEAGELVGGPMYMIRQGMGKRWYWMAGLYSFFGIAAAFGVGNATQINTVMIQVHSAADYLGLSVSWHTDCLLGILLAALTVGLMLGGAGRIGRTAEKLVPLAAGAYLLLGAGILIARRAFLPQAFASILTGAFTPGAVTGGVIGSMLPVLRAGIARGVFTNEAGMGTASIAHASAQTAHPAQQGMLGIIEVFVDTILICTMTALVILCSGVEIPYGMDTGAELTTIAFSSVYGGWVSLVLAAAVICFAFATVLGWGLYGIRCAQYLFGPGAWKYFAGLQGITVLFAAVAETGRIWMAAEIVNGLMAIPNLIALAALTPQLVQLTKEYEKTPLPLKGSGERIIRDQEGVFSGTSSPLSEFRRKERRVP